MFRTFLILSFPIFMFANFNFNDNYEKQITILRKFNVNSSFLHNKFLRNMILDYRSDTKRLLFFRAMSDAVQFLPAIKNLLAESKIPNEFLYLAMAESRLISIARSNKQAAGIWQFIPFTAKLYGLQVNNYIDERLDMLRSTEVAIKFLNDMHKRFKKWYLAAIAYNCGEGALIRAINKAGTDDLAKLINPDKKYLPRESRVYIRKILALALMEGSDEVFDSKYSYIFNVGNNSSLATIKIGGGERLVDIAKDINMKVADLQKLNPHILLGVTPPDNYGNRYNVYIPYFKVPEFRAKYKKKVVYSGDFEYQVKKGDTLYQICRKYKCDYKNIIKINNLNNSNLFAGQKIMIPILYNSNQNILQRIERESLLSNIKKVQKRYSVKKGDTLYSIARDLKIDVERLMIENHLTSSNIYIGESLIVQ